MNPSPVKTSGIPVLLLTLFAFFGFLVVPGLGTEPPELSALRQQYEKLYSERVAAVFDAAVHKLDESYVGGVDRGITEAKSAGDLPAVLALETEKKRLAGHEAIPADDSQVPMPLQKLRSIYREQLTKFEEQRQANETALRTPYEARLKQLEVILTKADRVDEAKTVLEYRESLATGGGGVTAGGFTNTLGMKFVPVKGTSVLFCIHETRRKDYAVYASEVPGVNGSWRTAKRGDVPVSEKDDDPVVSVNWDDANAFCTWMSKKEGKTYRLPTDREWSVAVDIGSIEEGKEGGTPESLSGKIADVFPWGTEWPPPPGAGNFADTSCKEMFPTQKTLEGYSDGFATTAPVMSFKASKMGLFDMSGNVWQWCGDWFNAAQAERVMRGGAWTDGGKGLLLSSERGHAPPGGRDVNRGFRCVVESAVH